MYLFSENLLYSLCIGFEVKPMHFGAFSFNFGVNKGSELIKRIGFIVTYASVQMIIFYGKEDYRVNQIHRIFGTRPI
jgi:hypothetical protein